MWTPFSQNLFLDTSGSAFGFGVLSIALLFVVIALWSLTWKTIAVWHAARNKQRLWMIALILVNTVGVLEIIYLAWFRKDNNGIGSEELYPFLRHIKNPLTHDSPPASEDQSGLGAKKKI